MRIFLALFVFNMIFRSLLSLTGYTHWVSDLEMRRYPKPLPTTSARAADETEEQTFSEVCDAFCDHWNPWPSEDTCERIEGWADTGKFVVAWVGTRMELVENMLGLNQQWTMFSPSVATERRMSRARLEFDDGSVEVVRLTSDPMMPTAFSHRFSTYRRMSYETSILRDGDTCVGYCNYLRHRFATNAAGAVLRMIYLYEIHYRYPNPDEDAWSVWQTQTGPPEWHKTGPVFVFNNETGCIRALSERERRRVKQRLAFAGQTTRMDLTVSRKK